MVFIIWEKENLKRLMSYSIKRLMIVNLILVIKKNNYSEIINKKINLNKLSINKYSAVEKLIEDIFNENYQCYGYRRIKVALKKEHNINISKKVIRKLVIKLKLIISTNKKKKYTSYVSKVTPIVPNII